jgi:1-pyrroline-5-carboxylate dehydrogenase
METELFGPVMTIYVYEDAKWEETLELVDSTSGMLLTGAVFVQIVMPSSSNCKITKRCW